MMPQRNNGFRSKSREHARRGVAECRDRMTPVANNPIAWEPVHGDDRPNGGHLTNAEVAGRIETANRRWEAILMGATKAKAKPPRRPRSEVTRKALRDYRAAWRSIRALMEPGAARRLGAVA